MTDRPRRPDFVPNDTTSHEAYDHAATHLHPLVLAHSLRVFLYAQALASRDNLSYAKPPPFPSPSPSAPHDLSLLFAACVLHDIGVCALHDEGPLRFEVAAADFASQFLTARGAEPDKAHAVWVAVAVHTSPHIAEGISSLARLLRLAVMVDFKVRGAREFAGTTEEEVDRAEKLLPRGEIEKVLGDAVADQAERRPEKGPPASWPGALLRAKKDNPGWKGVNRAF